MSSEDTFRNQYMYGGQPSLYQGQLSPLRAKNSLEEPSEQTQWKTFFSNTGAQPDARRKSDPNVREYIQRVNRESYRSVQNGFYKRRTSAPHALPKLTDSSYTSNSGDHFDIPRITFLGKVRKVVTQVWKTNILMPTSGNQRRVFPLPLPTSRGGNVSC